MSLLIKLLNNNYKTVKSTQFVLTNIQSWILAGIKHINTGYVHELSDVAQQIILTSESVACACVARDEKSSTALTHNRDKQPLNETRKHASTQGKLQVHICNVIQRGQVCAKTTETEDKHIHTKRRRKIDKYHIALT